MNPLPKTILIQRYAAINIYKHYGAPRPYSIQNRRYEKTGTVNPALP